MMKNIYKGEEHTEMRVSLTPSKKQGYSVLQMITSAICRTDVFASQYVLGETNIILGHEVCAMVVQSDKYLVGSIVTVDPYAVEDAVVGLDVDGTFAEYIQIDDRNIVECNEVWSKYEDPRVIAMIEPLSVYLNALYVDTTDKKVAVYGTGRIAKMTLHLLKGVMDIEAYDENNMYDVIIETDLKHATIEKLVSNLNKDGTLIFKSRNVTGVELYPFHLIKKNITCRFLDYLPFETVKDFLMENDVELESFFGDTYPLDDWEKAFDVSEHEKVFLRGRVHA